MTFLLCQILLFVLLQFLSLPLVWAEEEGGKYSWQELVVDGDKCTTIIVAKKASVGGPMTTHTADCSDCDFRISKVPARDWPVDATRPLYLYKGEYPSTLSENRGNTWKRSNLEGTASQLSSWGEESLSTGSIPQVSHTFALYEAGYAIMNEHQVSIGESTCASRFWAAPVTAGGKAMIEVRELSRLALERTTTARDAIILMGALAEKYGFYAADWSGGDASKGEGGEALTVVDKEEAWVFHILADDTGTSAVWAAQRVPDDHVSVVANQFVIRNIDPASPDFMYSSNIFEVAKRQKLWDETKGHLDFLKTFAPPRAHSPYSSRRVWRVFNLVAPSIALPPFTDAYASDYPFSVKADVPLDVADLMRIQRDHYEGTQFDLTKGIAAGPYGDPNRFDWTALPNDNLTAIDVIQGSYERSISLFRTSYSFVAQARDVPNQLALLWFGQYAPSSTSYAPLYVASEIVPLSYSRGSLFGYDSTIAFWNFCAVGNYASRFYKYAMQDVADLQAKLLKENMDAIKSVETRVMHLLTSTTVGSVSFGAPAVTAMLTETTNSEALRILVAWRDLLPRLITKYHDGYKAEGLHDSVIRMTKLFYPKSWLDATGFFDNKINTGPDVILFSPRTSSSSTANTQYSFSTLISTAFVSSVVSLVMGFVVAKRLARRNEYLPLV